MKKLSVNLLTNVLLLLVGVILIIFHGMPTLLIWLVRVMGVLFMLPAVVYLIMIAKRRADARTGADYMGVLPAIGGLCFGLVMLIKSYLFDEILQLLLGVMLVVLGLFHVIYLLLSRSNLRIKGWYYLCPLIVMLCGVLSLVLPVLRDNLSIVVLITGIGLLLFNFTSFQEYLAERRVRRAISRPDEMIPVPQDDSIADDEMSSEELM